MVRAARRFSSSPPSVRVRGRRWPTVWILPLVAHRVVAREILVRVSGDATEENIRWMVVLLEMARETAAAIRLGAR